MTHRPFKLPLDFSKTMSIFEKTGIFQRVCGYLKLQIDPLKFPVNDQNQHEAPHREDTGTDREGTIDEKLPATRPPAIQPPLPRTITGKTRWSTHRADQIQHKTSGNCGRGNCEGRRLEVGWSVEPLVLCWIWSARCSLQPLVFEKSGGNSKGLWVIMKVSGLL
jgi:hypothetical protein